MGRSLTAYTLTPPPPLSVYRSPLTRVPSPLSAFYSRSCQRHGEIAINPVRPAPPPPPPNSFFDLPFGLVRSWPISGRGILPKKRPADLNAHGTDFLGRISALWWLTRPRVIQSRRGRGGKFSCFAKHTFRQAHLSPVSIHAMFLLLYTYSFKHRVKNFSTLSALVST